MTATVQAEPHWSASLRKLHACDDAVAWAERYSSLDEAWSQCKRGNWMLWLAARTCDRKLVVLAACDCAELALSIFEKRYPDDKRPRFAIETARRWARGEATGAELRAARYAAYAAAAAARTKKLAECADIVRRHFPIAPSLNGGAS